MKLLEGCKRLITDPVTRRRFIKWKLTNICTGHGPTIKIPGGPRVSPADRFNDYVSIVIQHPSPAEWRLVDDLLTSDVKGTFVDVGANVGAMSLLAHSTGRASSIVAFEPAHRYCEAWHRNMTANNVRNATLFQAAVGDFDGIVDFRADPRMPLNGKIDRGEVHFSTQTQAVTIVKLDSLRGTQESVALLKIDVEGAEPLVIRGAQDLLKSGRVRSILFEFIVEFIEDMEEDPYEFVGSLTELGFRLYAIEPDGRQAEIVHNDPRRIVDDRRVATDAPLRPFEQINLVAKFAG